MRRSSLTGTAVLLILLTLGVGVSSAKPVLGIADQKPSTFDDTRLQGLRLRHARVYVPWDVLRDPNTLPTIDAWFAGAKRVGMQPLVTIARSRVGGRAGYKPSPAELVREFRRWRSRWAGQVDLVSTWNEANLGNSPQTVARWWVALSRACSRCTVLGADLLDVPNVVVWAQQFVAAAGQAPKVWGLHAYVDVNTFQTTTTRALLKHLKGDFWITETGGVANRVRPMYTFAGCGVRHQTRATKYLLKTIAGLSPRIKRIYLFNWGLGDNRASFDASFVDAKGRERPALNVVRRYLGQPTVAAPTGGLSPELASCKKGKRKVMPLQLPVPDVKPGAGKGGKPGRGGKPGKG